MIALLFMLIFGLVAVATGTTLSVSAIWALSGLLVGAAINAALFLFSGA